MGKNIINDNKDNIVLSIKNIELAEEQNDVYMTLTMPVATTRTNLNGLKFTADFFDKGKNTLVDMPLLVNRELLESGETDKLTHEFDGQNFNTDVIGVIYKTWIADYDDSSDIKVLMASSKVYKRFGATCNAIKDLYESGELEFSMELLATEIIQYADRKEVIDGTFIGHTVVSNGAERACSTNQLLVAEALVKDLEAISLKEKGGIDLAKEKKIENAGMSVNLIYSKINEQLGYDLWVSDLFLEDSKVVVRNWAEKTYEIMTFTIDGEEVNVDLESGEKGNLVWKSEDEVSDNDLKIAELEKANVELLEQVTNLESAQIVEPVVAEPSQNEPDDEPDDKQVEYAEKINELSEIVKDLTAEIEGLKPFKADFETLQAEKQAEELEVLKSTLTATAKLVIGEDGELTEDMTKAIKNANEKELKIAIADYHLGNLPEETIDDDKDEDEVITSSDGDNLNDNQESQLKRY